MLPEFIDTALDKLLVISRFLKITPTPALIISLLSVAVPVIVLPLAAAAIVISFPLMVTPFPAEMFVMSIVRGCAHTPTAKSKIISNTFNPIQKRNLGCKYRNFSDFCQGFYAFIL
jgi:hypothetical protein